MKCIETSRERAWLAFVLLAAGIVTAGFIYLLKERLGQAVVLTGPLLFGAGACAGLTWRRQRTSRVTAQEEKNLRRFATVVRDSNDAITIQDFQGGITAWNRGAELMYGYSEVEALAMNIERLTAPGKVAEQKDFIRRLVDGEAVTSFETQRVTQDGRVLDVWMTVTKLLDDAGNPVGLASTERDITARKRAEANLKRMATVVRDSNDAITVQDFDGKITAWNFGAKNIYGYSEDEALAKNIECFTTPEKVREQADFIRRLVEGEPVNSFETQRVTKDGRVLDVWLSLTKLLDDAGNPVGLASTERDITARKQAEVALCESERFAHATVDALSAHIAVLDHTGAIIAVNQAWRFFAEANPPILSNVNKGANYLSVCDTAKGADAEEAAAAAAGIRAVITGEKDAVEIEYPCHSPDTKRWFVCRASRFPGPGATRVVVAHENITERKKAEIALQENTLFLNALLAAIPVPVFYKDAEGRYLGANKAFEEFFGITHQEWIGKSVFEIASPELAAVYHTKDLELLRKPGIQVYDAQVHDAQGRIHDVVFHKATFTESGGTVSGLIGVILDITERMRAEAEHEELQARFAQAQKMESVGRLAGGVAHDFNNLIMVIMGNAELCREQIEPGHPIRESLDEITSAARRAAETTGQLLAFARKQIIAPRILDLNDAVAGMLKLLRRLIGEDINLVWRPGPTLPPVKLDPSQVDQILANLCVKSRDASAGVGEIALETGSLVVDEETCARHPDALPGAYAFLAVSDSGSGMDKETLAQVFEPFFTTKAIGKGTGLGLATVYGIVKQNNGFIDAFSEPGKGTTFKICLPQVEAEAESSVASKEEAPEGRGETILLVEDEKSLGAICRRFLDTLGYQILMAGTPGEALKMVARHPGDIHLLLTDVVMPGMDGRQLAQRIRAVKPGVKVLYMSGYTADVIAQRGVLDEGVQFLPKPFTRDVLARKVRAVLDEPCPA